MRNFLLFISSALLSAFALTACTPEQKIHTVPPGIWHSLTAEQQQLIADQANNPPQPQHTGAAS